MKRLITALAAAVFPSVATSQATSTSTAKCDTLCLAAARTISFETTQGTRMGVSISPDGKTIVFDLLGDIYSVPITGGAATHLTKGMAFDFAPVFSPDGRQIAFVSDRSGSENVWIMNADGTSPRALTKDRSMGGLGSEFKAPEWSPDGQYIMVSKGSTVTLYHKDGGSGAALAKNLGGVGHVWSPDGRYVYFGGRGSSAREDIKRLDRVTGEVIPITEAPGGGARPAISPDGKKLVYVTNADARSGLRVHDIETGHDEWLYYPIDFEEDFLRPRFQFTPDGRAVVIAMDGTFQEIPLDTKQPKKIAFTAKVEQQLGPFIYNEYRVTNEPLTVRAMRSAAINPAGTQLVFNAVNKLWVMDLPNGTPRELVKQNDWQFYPKYSPDGSSIAYVTWDEGAGGHLWRVPLSGGTPQRLTTYAAYYSHPAWSPDGSKIAFIREGAADASKGVLQWMPSSGGTATTVTTASAEDQVTFSSDGTRLMFVTGSELTSIRTDGFDKRVLAKFSPSEGGSVGDVIPSPDGQWVAYTVREDLFLAALPPAAEPPTITDKSGPGPFKRVTREGGIDPRWVNDGKTLTWMFANKFYRVDRERIIAATSDTAIKPEVTTINLAVPRRRGSGTVALRNARIITMKGNEVIGRGDIVVTDDRITAIGASGKVSIPKGARVFDLSGKTIIPGLIDMHAHYMYFSDVFPRSHWQPYANLAYGVTTARDPSGSNEMFQEAELIEAGVMPGPRLFPAGRAMLSSVAQVESLDDARAIVRHYKQLGAVFLKEYAQPTRRQRQWLAQAAREEGLNMTAESWTMSHHYTMVMDGYTGVEHAVKDIYNPYEDILKFRAQSKTWYTPTLMSGAGGIRRGGFYFYQFTQPHDDAKLARFTPHDVLDRRTRTFQAGHRDEYIFDRNGAMGALGILKEGGNVTAGGHGEQQGIGLHWEMWLMNMAGFTPHQAIRAATLSGAEGLGMAKDLGSLEVGKLADLVVLDGNPLADIKNTNTIRYVMKNGEIYKGDDLKMIWPTEQPLPAFSFRNYAPPKKK
jgi:Tol biopolymer transport system component/imidazolonepropionase-like amidohydrolase